MTLPSGPRYGQVDREYALRLATTPAADDGPVWMINLMKYRDRADYADGRESSISGREADNLYAPIESLTAVGATIVFAGDVVQQLEGPEPAWDRVGIVKYPTRRSFIAMQSRPDFQAKHVHKEAGMQETIVLGCLPAETRAAEVEATSTPGPQAITIFHVIRHAEPTGTATPAGGREQRGRGRDEVLFRVEGTILGDGRAWDEVHVTSLPEGTPADVARPAGNQGREVAASYLLVTRPAFNRLRESLDG